MRGCRQGWRTGSWRGAGPRIPSLPGGRRHRGEVLARRLPSQALHLARGHRPRGASCWPASGLEFEEPWQSGRILPGRVPPGLRLPVPTSRRCEERHAKGDARHRAHRGPPEGRPEVPSPEVLRQGGAGQEHRDLPGGAPESAPILGAPGSGAPLDQAVAKGPRLEAPLREVVRWRQAQRLRQLPGSPRRGPASQQGGDRLGGRAGRRSRADVSRPVARGQPLRRRPPAPRGRRRAIPSRFTCR